MARRKYFGYHRLDDEIGIELFSQGSMEAMMDNPQVRNVCGPFTASTDREALQIAKQKLGPPQPATNA